MLSYRKLAMRVLGRPLHTGGNDSPRPASQRAAAFALTAAMLITLTAPAFAETWYIENGDITVKASGTEGKNTVSQGDKKDVEDTNTIITNQKTDKASSNTVTIEANGKNDKVEVTLKDVNIDTSSRNNAAVSVTGSGNTTIKLDGDNHLTGGDGSSTTYTRNFGQYGISGNGNLTITGGENDSLTAKGGDGGCGGGGIAIDRGSLTISGGTVNAASGQGGGNAGMYGSGIYINVGSGTVSGGTVNATGSDGKGYGQGGSGIYGSLTVSGGTVNATGGDGAGLSGGDGIYGGSVTISGDSKVTATGGKGGNGHNGGNGIYSNGRSGVTISGGTVTANGGSGGNGNNSYGGTGIYSGNGRVAISGGTVEAAGGNGNNGGGNSIYSRIGIDLSGSLELTAKAGNPNRGALSQNGKELDLDTINKDKLDPGAKVTTTDADGKVIQQVSIPRPVEPEKPVIPGDSSSSSGGGSAGASVQESVFPGLVVTDKDGQRISYTSIRGNNVLSLRVGRFTASLRASLAALRQLRAEGIDTITFQTILCSTTLSVDELLAMGGEDAEAVLTHRFTASSLTVG